MVPVTRRDLEAWQLLIGTTSELMKEMDVGNGRYQLSKSSAFIEGNFIDTVQREVLLTRFAHSEEERVAVRSSRSLRSTPRARGHRSIIPLGGHAHPALLPRPRQAKAPSRADPAAARDSAGAAHPSGRADRHAGGAQEARQHVPAAAARARVTKGGRGREGPLSALGGAAGTRAE